MARDKNGLKKQTCMCCRRPLEPVKTQWASGPVCLSCYWAAKFYFECNYEGFDQIPPEFASQIGDLFIKSGYLFPDDLIEAFRTKPFNKASTMLRRWWSPKYHVEEEIDKATGTEVSQNTKDVLSQGKLF
jgi:hypothetical protein